MKLRGEHARRAGRAHPRAGPAAALGAAQQQSALTHGHPTALAASDLTAHAVWLLAQGTGPAGLLLLLREYARQARSVYRADWLGDLAEHAHDPDRASFTARGWDECLAALDRVEAALPAADPEADPCLAAGEGWIAEEALAVGLYCFLLLPDDPQAVVRRFVLPRVAGDRDGPHREPGHANPGPGDLAGLPGFR